MYVVLHSSYSEAVHMQPDHLVVQTVVISVVYIRFMIYVHSFKTTVYWLPPSLSPSVSITHEKSALVLPLSTPILALSLPLPLPHLPALSLPLPLLLLLCPLPIPLLLESLCSSSSDNVPCSSRSTSTCTLTLKLIFKYSYLEVVSNKYTCRCCQQGGALSVAKSLWILQ